MNKLFVELSPDTLDKLEERIIARFKSEGLSFSPNPTPTKEIDGNYLTIKEVSTLIGVSQVTLHKWKKQGKLKFYRFGSRIRFLKSEVISIDKYNKKGK